MATIDTQRPPDSVMVRVHEIALKGRNRPLFFQRLRRNLRLALRGTPVRRVESRHLGVEVSPVPDSSWPEIAERIGRVFGVVKFYRCRKVGRSLEAIEAALVSETEGLDFATFRITSKRSDKTFPLTSLELNRRLGSLVECRTGARVSLREPEVNIFVEVTPREVLVYLREMPGPGGLPVGSGGRVAALMSGGIDSPVAAWRMMKRGCQVLFVHFHSFPLVDGSSREKVLEIAELLSLYQYRSTLLLVPFADVQREIILSVPPAYRVVVYRRFMTRIAERIATNLGAGALVTGESLGQVGSQTLENLTTVRSVATLPVLSPLIGMDKQEIIGEAQRIGTFPISILPDEDCCSLFTPRHPATRTTAAEVERLESALDVPALVERAVAQAEVRRVTASGYSAERSSVVAARHRDGAKVASVGGGRNRGSNGA